MPGIHVRSDAIHGTPSERCKLAACRTVHRKATPKNLVHSVSGGRSLIFFNQAKSANVVDGVSTGLDDKCSHRHRLDSVGTFGFFIAFAICSVASDSRMLSRMIGAYWKRSKHIARLCCVYRFWSGCHEHAAFQQTVCQR